MPKRVVDGDALWRSRKLLLVPVEYRGEYANLVPLADVNGSFECDPTSVWADVYSFNRQNVSPTDVAAMLDAFEAAGMLIRWKQEGKTWGHFVGIDAPGRLPSGKHKSRYRNLPPMPPSIRNGEVVPESPGNSGRLPEIPALGLGLGKGKGSAFSGNFPEGEGEPNQNFEGAEWALRTAKAYPLWKDPDAQDISPVLGNLYMETIEREAPARGGKLPAAEWLLARVVRFGQMHKERGTDPQFIPSLKNFLTDGVYATVEMPATRTRLSVESDEDCETRLRGEGRERRRAANGAKEVAATV